MNVRIRPATVDDAHAIAEVHVRSWQHAYRELLPREFLAGLSVPKRTAMWAESLDQGRSSLLVAEADGAVAGFAAFGPCRDADAGPAEHELCAIYVMPACWSAGLGRGLWRESNAAMAAQGAGSVSLWVLAGNDRAIRFYAAAGFRPQPGSERTLTLAGVQLQEVRHVWRRPSPAVFFRTGH